MEEAKKRYVEHFPDDAGHRIEIALTDDQAKAFHKLTGERISTLRLRLEELADLADLVTN